MLRSLVLKFLLLVAASRSAFCVMDGELALPMINAHFEYANTDSQIDDAKALISFNTRANHLQQNIESDLEALSEFAEIVNSKLAEVKFLQRKDVA